MTDLTPIDPYAVLARCKRRRVDYILTTAIEDAEVLARAECEMFAPIWDLYSEVLRLFGGES